MRKKQMIGYGVLFIAVCVFGYLIYSQGRIISDQTVFPEENDIISEDEVPAQSISGNDRDEHGCIGSAGYTWCEAKKKCIRSWEEKCEADDGNISDNNTSETVPNDVSQNQRLQKDTTKQ